MRDASTAVEFSRAIEDFKRARAKAQLQQFWSAITQDRQALLAYDEISKKLHAKGLSSKGLREIPVQSIVGSVNRYQDFNRNFLPLHRKDIQRWAGVKAMMTSPGSAGLPPIRVYQLGEAYFVLDGNHRVSIAREMGIDTIEAYVTEIRSPVVLTPDDSAEDIILKEEYADFLDETHIDEILPGVSLRLSFPGQYETLKEHIRVHRHYLGIEQQREIPYEEAVRHWYEAVYQPVVAAIHAQEMQKAFPDRTETDLYLWVLDHQSSMQDALGWPIRPEKAASHLAERRGSGLLHVLKRIIQRIVQLLVPDVLEDYSSPGEWHSHKKLSDRQLFRDILVALDGGPEGWLAIEQAIILARLENADVRGLVVTDKERRSLMYDPDELSQAYSRRLAHAGVHGNLVIAEGNIAEMIVERADVNDLVVLRLSHPPATQLFKRLGSGIRTILRQSSRPILMVRDWVSSFNRILLAYDGSPKGREALFISTFLAKQYHKEVVILVVARKPEEGSALLNDAQLQLGNGYTEGLLVESNDKISDVILQTAYQHGCDVIVMGGYGLPPLWEAIFGSVVDDVLRSTFLPVLICQ